jgi:hypothetical protein
LIPSFHINASVTIFRQQVIKNKSLLFEVKESNAQKMLVSLYDLGAFNYPKFYKMDNLSKLGWLGAAFLLDTDFKNRAYAPESIALVLCNRNSSLDTDLKYYESVKTIASPALFVYTLPNIVMGEISIRHQIKGENAFFVFEEFNAEFIYQYVSELLNSGAADACVCGWVEFLDQEYKLVLLLVEKKDGNDTDTFTIENINQTYLQANG